MKRTISLFLSLCLIGSVIPLQAFATGETASFTVAAQGDTLKYQWYSSSDGESWSASYLAGYNTDTFSFIVNTNRATKIYKCVITDVVGNTVETDAVSVTIRQ